MTLRLGGARLVRRLSVLIPVRNQERYVELAIQSLLDQTFKDFDLLVVDDGSTDETPRILERIAARDDRVKAFLRPNRGLPATRNELLQLAETPFVAWLDSDDVSTPERLERQLDAMLQDEELWLLGTAMASIDANGNVKKPIGVITGAKNVARGMERGCKVAQTSCMMRREPVVALGGYRAAFTFAQDYDLFLRISERGKVDNLPFVGVHYREHGNAVTTKNNLMQNLLADLARASHCRRMEGLPDPTDDLTQGPDLYDEPILDAMLGEQVNIYRALDRITNDSGDPTENLRTLIENKPSRKQRQKCQEAILGLVKQRGFDALSARALLRVASLGPGRLLRLRSARA